MSVDTSHLYKTAHDWQAKSIGDVSAFGGVGGGVKHFAIWSPSLKLGAQSVIAFVGFGAEAKAKVPKINEILGDSYEFVKSFIENSGKFVEGGVKAASGYEPLTVFRAFSLNDFSGSQIAQAEAGAAVIGGLKVEGLTAYCGLKPIFSIPPSIGAAWSLGAGAQSSVGFIFTDIQRQISTAQKFNIELKRKASDPLPRPAGGW